MIGKFKISLFSIERLSKSLMFFDLNSLLSQNIEDENQIEMGQYIGDVTKSMTHTKTFKKLRYYRLKVAHNCKYTRNFV